jgi:hypothetical protein
VHCGRPSDRAARMPECKALNSVQSGEGIRLGSSDPVVENGMTDGGALIKLTNLDSNSHLRKDGSRAGKKSSRELLGTEVQVNEQSACALLDPGCEAELILSAKFATRCGIDTKPDGIHKVELADGTQIQATCVNGVSLSVAGISHLFRATVVELTSYEVILGKPWFTRHNPVVDWKRNRLTICVDGISVEVDASSNPHIGEAEG